MSELTILVTCLITGAAQLTATPSEAQVSVSTDSAFQEEFEVTDEAYGQRVRRLRIAGWFGFGLATALGAATWAHALIYEFDSSYSGLIRYSVVFGISGALGLTSVACLIAARIKVGRRRRFRRRFRERQAALDRSYFHPEVDIGITPGGLSLHLSF